MTIGLRGVDTIELTSEAPGRLVEFYARAFGLAFAYVGGSYVAWVGATCLLVKEPPTLVRFGALLSLEWSIDSAAEAASELRARGIAFGGPMSADRDDIADALECVYVDDPDGNRVWLIERVGS